MSTERNKFLQLLAKAIGAPRETPEFGSTEPEKDADDDAQALEILNRPAKFFESIK